MIVCFVVHLFVVQSVVVKTATIRYLDTKVECKNTDFCWSYSPRNFIAEKISGFIEKFKKLKG